MRLISLIVCHCSGTKVTQRYTFNQCRHDHIHNNRWHDIGYHYYIEHDGTVHKGSPESQKGAHVKDHNAHSIGICYEGGLDKDGYPCDTRTPEQLASMENLIADLHARYPKAIILGHRDLSPDLNGDGKITPNEYLKQCPCFDAMLFYEQYQPDGFWEGKPIW